jgi:predicted dehydrogenase
MHPVGFGVIGAGYWGPNLVRNIASNPATDLRWVCDLRLPVAERLASTFAGARSTDQYRDVLDDPAVEAVAIATPAATHAQLAIEALDAGKHVLIEKPIAASVDDAEKMILAATREQRVLMCDHTYCYSPSVRYIRSVIEAGGLGDILFVDSVRINLGLVQSDVNVLWDLAPHDLSILDFVLPVDRSVERVAATGSDPIGAGQECVGHLSLGLRGGSSAHVHVNWLSPTKVRTMVIGGSERTLVWDDLNPTQRISIFDRGIEIDGSDDEQVHRNRVSYRVGDVTSPALADTEALAGVITSMAAAVCGEADAPTDGMSGLRVLQTLEAADRSLRSGGVSLPVVLAGRP